MIKYMFMAVIRVYCGLPQKIGSPNILQLLILGTQFPNPGWDPGMDFILSCDGPMMD